MAADSLFVVDTTVSYGDTYPFICSNVDIRIKLQEESSQRHALVLYCANRFPAGLPPWTYPAMVVGATYDPATGKVTENPGFWGNWVRVYIPADARAITVEGLIDPAPTRLEFGRLVVAGYLPLSPGQRKTVSIGYLTKGGKGLTEGYQLFLQKQAGLQARPISMTVEWPTGEVARYSGSPARDQWVELHGTRKGATTGQ